MRHWKTEIVAGQVELLSGRRKKDYDAEQAADALVAQAEKLGDTIDGASVDPSMEGEADDEDEADADELLDPAVVAA